MTYLRTILTTSILTASLGLCACSNAQSAPGPDAETTALEMTKATAWTIQSEGSHLKFSALQEGEAFTGEFTEFSGDIHFDPDNLAGSQVKIAIPLASVSAGSKDRDNTLPGKVWFSTKKFPEAVFESDTIIGKDGAYEAMGTLTLKGRTESVTLPFEVDIAGDTAVMTGGIQMDRTRWDVGAEPWNTDEWVSRSVELDIQVTATRAD